MGVLDINVDVLVVGTIVLVFVIDRQNVRRAGNKAGLVEIGLTFVFVLMADILVSDVNVVVVLEEKVIPTLDMKKNINFAVKVVLTKAARLFHKIENDCRDDMMGKNREVI